MITAGIDIGSVATKAVVLDNDKVLGKAVVKSQMDQQATAETVLSESLSQAQIGREEVKAIATTGYGRRAIGFGDKVITEISAGAMGAFFLGAPWGKPRIVADLGGQDTKVVLLENDGSMADFRMNDKCAAGTGRFLEVMAGVLGVSLDELGDMSLRSKEPATINSTCTVFAESEVISLIASGTAKEDIIAGLHNSVASRMVAMLRQMGDHDVFFMGGGSNNKGVCKALEDLISRQLYVPPDPQFVVALGAALLAR
ncbi:acyl-CoA dehydratase activase [Verrucomicrobiota bacterium]